jgi:predicted nucleic acid binding AN1-type Zn finger protein
MNDIELYRLVRSSTYCLHCQTRRNADSMTEVCGACGGRCFYVKIRDEDHPGNIGDVLRVVAGLQGNGWFVTIQQDNQTDEVYETLQQAMRDGARV